MTLSTNTPTTGGQPHPHPVVALREHVTQAMSAADRLRSDLAAVADLAAGSVGTNGPVSGAACSRPRTRSSTRSER
jgi:hypothetical protein